jgi:hypothetical protein
LSHDDESEEALVEREVVIDVVETQRGPSVGSSQVAKRDHERERLERLCLIRSEVKEVQASQREGGQYPLKQLL